MALTEDQREVLKYLSTTHRALHKERMTRSFRIVVTALTFYTLSVAAALSKETQLPTFASFDCLVWAFFLVVASFVAWDSYASGKANEWNQRAAQAAEDSLIDDLGSLYKKPTSDNPRRQAWLWEVIIIFAGAVNAAIVITWSK